MGFFLVGWFWSGPWFVLGFVPFIFGPRLFRMLVFGLFWVLFWALNYSWFSFGICFVLGFWVCYSTWFVLDFDFSSRFCCFISLWALDCSVFSFVLGFVLSIVQGLVFVLGQGLFCILNFLVIGFSSGLWIVLFWVFSSPFCSVF